MLDPATERLPSPANVPRRTRQVQLVLTEGAKLADRCHTSAPTP
jgi:hypothetical protein